MYGLPYILFFVKTLFSFHSRLSEVVKPMGISLEVGSAIVNQQLGGVHMERNRDAHYRVESGIGPSSFDLNH